MNCNICNKEFYSNSSLAYHKREKHTFSKTIISKCAFCNKDFHAINGKEKLLYSKCEECRDIQKKLNTNDLVNNTYVYDKNKRYFLQDGNYTKVCPIYTCKSESKITHGFIFEFC
jgi:hypothetical protein